MSSSLEWKPYPTKGITLPGDLKLALRKRFSGSVREVMRSNDLPYLEGLRDGGMSSAQILIDAINKHGEIEVAEVF